jgi:hypothetical protein
MAATHQANITWVQLHPALPFETQFVAKSINNQALFWGALTRPTLCECGIPGASTGYTNLLVKDRYS